VVLGAAVMLGIAHAQSAPTFEVSQAIAGGLASGPLRPMGRASRTPLKIAFQSALLGDIMAFAYELPLDRIERRPQWMYDDRFNVAVTTAEPTALPEQKLMLQRLLEERFGLVVHRVSNPSPVYFLVAGANVNLTPSKESDPAASPGFRTPAQALGFSSGFPGITQMGSHVSMGDLAAWLSGPLQLPVLDKTGMTGFFDIQIPRLPARGGSEGIIRAVRKALGLDLELHPGTAESLIIDQVNKPGQ
jgi:uncharacterized protein (TIGR03435 family)